MAHAIPASESKLGVPPTTAATVTIQAAPTRPLPVDRFDDDLGDQDVTQTMLEYLPSWLVSLVAHLVLVLMLALFTVAKGGIGTGDGLLINVIGGGNGGPGNDDLWAAALETPSELLSTPPLETPSETVELTEPLDTTTDIDLVDPIEQPELKLPNEIVGTTNGTDDAGQGGGTGDGTGTGDGNAIGDAAQTAIFGIVDEGMDFVYVFDRSESMNSRIDHKIEDRVVYSITPLSAAKAELIKSLSDLKVQNRFHILFYNHDAWLFDSGRNSKGLITATDENKTRALAFIDSVYGDGQTRHVPPLEAAIRMRPDVIFLLTDGEEKDDPTPAELGRLRKLNKGRSRINVIQFVYSSHTSSALETLAAENGGRHKYIDISQLGPMSGVVLEKQIPKIQAIAPAAADATDADDDAGAVGAALK
jgi:hypothetical protein